MNSLKVGLGAVLVCIAGCAVDAGGAEDTATSEPEAATEALASTTPWKMATLVFKSSDFWANGKRYQSTMTATEVSNVRAAATGVPAMFAKFNRGFDTATMAVIEPTETLGAVSYLSGDDDWWVSPANVAAALDKYAPKGRYDSVFVFWDPGALVVKTARGQTSVGADTNGGTFASLPPVFGTEGMIHEWLHGSAAYFRSRGFDTPDPHDNRIFGYPSANAAGSWSAWYTGAMSGRLFRKGGRAGFTEYVWQAGTPTHPTTPTSSLFSVPDPPPPVLTGTYVIGDWVHVAWKPSPGVSYYVARVYPKRSNGTLATPVTYSGMGAIDRGAENYTYFTKSSLCTSAKASGLVGWVNFEAKVDALGDPTLRDSQAVSGSLYCP